MTAWPKRASRQAQIEQGLLLFSNRHRALMGVRSPVRRAVLAKQMVASVRRRDYRDLARTRQPSADRADPGSPMFDPERGAVWLASTGQADEAVWLVFLGSHFGKHRDHGWRRARDIYSGLGAGTWTWARVSASPAAFRAWLASNRGRIGGGFSNHRKYESLDAHGPKGTGAVMESFVQWVGPSRSPAARFSALVRAAGNNPHTVFDRLYSDFSVTRFGRLGKFDFLTAMGRLGLLPIEPGVAYLKGATGPLRGARLLVSNNPTAALGEDALERLLVDLDQVLGVGMEVMEDSLCNWQKSPDVFVHFRG